MKSRILGVKDFERFIPRVKCINLFHYKLLSAPKLEEISTVEQLEFENVEDFATLAADNLVWYVNSRGEYVFWDARGARNLTVAEQADRHLKDPSNKKLSGMIDSIKDGLFMDIELLQVYDTVVRERVIVDGVYRAVALYCLYLTDKDALSRLLKGKFRVFSVVLKSPAGALLFPCDFVNICRDFGGKPSPSYSSDVSAAGG